MKHYQRALTQKAITAALTLRAENGRRLDEPVCVFDLAQDLGLRVRFDQLDTKNFEGIYTPPIRQISLEPRRPPLRQRFTCAHELGHHVFKHGQVPNCTSHDGSISHTNTPQEELLANEFAAFLLMPKAAVFTAFRRRGRDLHEASADDLYIISCDLGVGFSTLINHCAKYFPERFPRTRADAILRQTRALAPLRARLLGGLLPETQLSHTTVYHVTPSWTRPVDLIVGSDAGRGDIVKFEFDLSSIPPTLQGIGHRCYRAVKEGTHPVSSNEWSGIIRCYNPVLGGLWKVRIAGDDD